MAHSPVLPLGTGNRNRGLRFHSRISSPSLNRLMTIQSADAFLHWWTRLGCILIIIMYLVLRRRIYPASRVRGWQFITRLTSLRQLRPCLASVRSGGRLSSTPL